jgi:RHS repeat-associated protein
MDLVYGYDAANNVKTITDNVTPANNQTLGYGVLNRLTTGTGSYGSYTWTYDKVGNLQSLKIGSVTTTYGYATGTNRLSTIAQGTTTNVLTNANGNITSIPPANSSTVVTFSYNVANRLSSVTGTSPAISNIVYDGFGRRFSKQDSGSNPADYTYDVDGNLVEENISGAVTDYVYLYGMPIGVFVPGSNPPTTAKLYFAHADRQGVPQLVTDSTQTAVWTTTYQPYGTTPTIISSIVQNLRFPGQHFDFETGFHYNNARDYMPNLGRYLEADLIGLGGGLNTFLYANGNPGTFTDKWGLDSAQTMIDAFSHGLDYEPPANIPSPADIAVGQAIQQLPDRTVIATNLDQAGDALAAQAVAALLSPNPLTKAAVEPLGYAAAACKFAAMAVNPNTTRALGFAEDDLAHILKISPMIDLQEMLMQ